MVSYALLNKYEQIIKVSSQERIRKSCPELLVSLQLWIYLQSARSGSLFLLSLSFSLSFCASLPRTTTRWGDLRTKEIPGRATLVGRSYPSRLPGPICKRSGGCICFSDLEDSSRQSDAHRNAKGKLYGSKQLEHFVRLDVLVCLSFSIFNKFNEIIKFLNY